MHSSVFLLHDFYTCLQAAVALQSSECARQLACPKIINLNSCGTPLVTCLAVRTFVLQGGNVCADHCVQRAVHDVAVLCFGVRMHMGPIAHFQTSCGIVWTCSN